MIDAAGTRVADPGDRTGKACPKLAPLQLPPRRFGAVTAPTDRSELDSGGGHDVGHASSPSSAHLTCSCHLSLCYVD
jgi:hypothetical protein